MINNNKSGLQYIEIPKHLTDWNTIFKDDKVERETDNSHEKLDQFLLKVLVDI